MSRVQVRTGSRIALAPGGVSSGARPAGVPALVNGQLHSAPFVWFDDFTRGIVAVNGQPNMDWRVSTQGAGGGTIVWGLNGTTAPSASSGGIFGAIQLQTSATNDTGSICEKIAKTVITAGPTYTDTGDQCLLFGGSSSTITKALYQYRYTTSSLTNHNFCFGALASGIALGGAVVVDPDTTLTGNSSWVISRHAAAYSGDTAGALVLRTYGASGETSHELGAAASGQVKVELLFDYAAATITVYINGAVVGAYAQTVAWFTGTTAMRPFFGNHITTGTTNRVLTVDSLYYEAAPVTAR